MTIERTLSIIKPDAVAKNVVGQIYARFEAAGLKVVAARMAHLSRGEAEAFYAVHKARPFFKDLVDFMISRSEERRVGKECRKRYSEESRSDGRNGPKEGGCRNHPRRLCGQHRRKCSAWF